MSAEVESSSVLHYWLGQDSSRWRSLWDPCNTPKNMSKWFMKSDEVDAEIRQNFAVQVDRLPEVIQSAKSLDDKIAAIILGDQMSRNIYRGESAMYRHDGIVLPLAKSLLESKDPDFMEEFPLTFKLFTLLPLMHSEVLEDQILCCEWVKTLYESAPEGEPGGADGQKEAAGRTSDAKAFLLNMMDYAEKHRDIVRKYGRFPHRNGILGRPSTEEEARGLEDGSIQKF